MLLNEKIYQLRKNKGFSQEDLAKRVGVSRQTIHKWEAGRICPTKENIEILCKIFDVEEQYFSEAAIATNAMEKPVVAPKRKFIVSIALTITSAVLCAITTFVVYCMAQTVFSPNTGDEVAKIYDIDISVFILVATIAVVLLALAIVGIIVSVRTQKRL